MCCFISFTLIKLLNRKRRHHGTKLHFIFPSLKKSFNEAALFIKNVKIFTVKNFVHVLLRDTNRYFKNRIKHTFLPLIVDEFVFSLIHASYLKHDRSLLFYLLMWIVNKKLNLKKINLKKFKKPTVLNKYKLKKSSPPVYIMTVKVPM